MHQLLSALFSALLAAACISPAFAADAPQPPAKPEAAGQIVTPEDQAATLKGIIAKMKSDAKAKKENQSEAKK